METDPRRAAGLAPVIVVLALLVSISLLGLIVALWPQEQAAAASQDSRDQAASPDPSSCGRDCYAPPRNGTEPKWM